MKYIYLTENVNLRRVKLHTLSFKEKASLIQYRSVKFHTAKGIQLENSYMYFPKYRRVLRVSYVYV